MIAYGFSSSGSISNSCASIPDTFPSYCAQCPHKQLFSPCNSTANLSCEAANSNFSLFFATSKGGTELIMYHLRFGKDDFHLCGSITLSWRETTSYQNMYIIFIDVFESRNYETTEYHTKLFHTTKISTTKISTKVLVFGVYRIRTRNTNIGCQHQLAGMRLAAGNPIIYCKIRQPPRDTESSSAPVVTTSRQLALAAN
jgi:hypothetical protein